MKKEIFQQEIEDWDKNAEFYANENLMPYQKVIREKLAEFYALSEREKILETGGGVIKISKNTVLVDFSPKMVELAKKINPPDREIILASCHELPFKNETFDAIVANGLFHHLKAQDLLEASAREFYRVLKPGGRLCVFDRADNLVPKIFFYLRKPVKLIFKPKSQCCTRNEQPFLEEDIEKILSRGFKKEKRQYLVTLPFQFLVIFSNFLQYSSGSKTAQKFQERTLKLAASFEKHLAFKPLCAEQCLVLRKA